MANLHRQNLLQSIATTIDDYRKGEIESPTPDHVDRWVSQFSRFGFPEEEQLIILQEMDRVLKTYYVSKQKTIDILTEALTTKIFGEKTNPSSLIPKLKFLDIQRNGKGSSQKDLLSLADKIIQSHYGISIKECGGDSPAGYVYLDDALYSGNTVRYDIKEFLPTTGGNINLIFLIFLATYTSGLSYLVRNTNSDNTHVKSWEKFKFHNDTYGTSRRFDGFWNRELLGDVSVDSYVNEIKSRCTGKKYAPRIFRPKSIDQEIIFFFI
jgi:hypothetical protein